MRVERALCPLVLLAFVHVVSARSILDRAIHSVQARVHPWEAKGAVLPAWDPKDGAKALADLFVKALKEEGDTRPAIGKVDVHGVPAWIHLTRDDLMRVKTAEFKSRQGAGTDNQVTAYIKRFGKKNNRNPENGHICGATICGAAGEAVTDFVNGHPYNFFPQSVTSNHGSFYHTERMIGTLMNVGGDCSEVTARIDFKFERPNLKVGEVPAVPISGVDYFVEDGPTSTYTLYPKLGCYATLCELAKLPAKLPGYVRPQFMAKQALDSKAYTTVTLWGNLNPCLGLPDASGCPQYMRESVDPADQKKLCDQVANDVKKRDDVSKLANDVEATYGNMPCKAATEAADRTVTFVAGEVKKQSGAKKRKASALLDASKLEAAKGKLDAACKLAKDQVDAVVGAKTARDAITATEAVWPARVALAFGAYEAVYKTADEANIKVAKADTDLKAAIDEFKKEFQALHKADLAGDDVRKHVKLEGPMAPPLPYRGSPMGRAAKLLRKLQRNHERALLPPAAATAAAA